MNDESPIILAAVSYEITFAAADQSFSAARSYYDDKDCKIAAETTSFAGKYSIPTGLAVSPGTTPIDFSILRAETVRLTKENVEISSRLSECGISDWVIGEKRDVTATQYARYDFVGRTQYSLFQIRDGALFLDRSSNDMGRTPKERPKEANGLPFRR